MQLARTIRTKNRHGHEVWWMPTDRKKKRRNLKKHPHYCHIFMLLPATVLSVDVQMFTQQCPQEVFTLVIVESATRYS